MIIGINLNRLSNQEFLHLGKDIIQICEKFDPLTNGFKSKLDLFEKKWAELDIIFEQENSNVLSAVLENLDLRRDNSITGIKLNLESFLRHYDPSKVAAAELALATLNKYGDNIANQNFMSETNSLKSLGYEFSTPGPEKDAIDLLGLAQWVEEMKDSNQEFYLIFLKRNEETGQKPEGTFTEMRNPAKAVYDELMLTIRSLYVVNGGQTLSNLTKEINALIVKNNIFLADR